MGSLTDYAEGKWLDHVFNAAYSPVATVYVALCTADPTDAATGAVMNEVPDANNYAREAIAFSAAASRKVIQSGAIEFNTASGAWGTVTHWAIVDSVTHGAGNVLAHGAFATGKIVVNGNTPTIPDASIEVEISAGEISTTLVHSLLNLMFRNIAYGAPDTFVGLIITNPIVDTDTGSTVTEPAGGSYARKQVNINGGSEPTWDMAAGTTPTEVDNTHDITLVTATAAWGTVIAVGTFSAVTAGDLLYYDNDMADQAVAETDTVVFPAGAMDIQQT